MNAFANPSFIIFAALLWLLTAAWAYAVVKLQMRRRALRAFNFGVMNFIEGAFQIGVLPSIALWLGLAPFVAGYGQIVFSLECIAGLAVSVVIVFFTIAYTVKEEDLLPVVMRLDDREKPANRVQRELWLIDGIIRTASDPQSAVEERIRTLAKKSRTDRHGLTHRELIELLGTLSSKEGFVADIASRVKGEVLGSREESIGR